MSRVLSRPILGQSTYCFSASPQPARRRSPRRPHRSRQPSGGRCIVRLLEESAARAAELKQISDGLNEVNRYSLASEVPLINHISTRSISATPLAAYQINEFGGEQAESIHRTTIAHVHCGQIRTHVAQTRTGQGHTGHGSANACRRTPPATALESCPRLLAARESHTVNAVLVRQHGLRQADHLRPIGS
jgi:hypothetical protein